LTAIKHELLLRKREAENDKIKTIYFGGGTPSLLTIGELQSLMDTIYQHYKVTEHPEISLEANPDDLSGKKIEQLSATMINRLSIGIQSFFEEDLRFMNRAHSAIESRECLSAAIESFDNITIDLIYGLPNLSNEKWQENLNVAFDFGVPHISSYALTVEERTALNHFIKKGKVPPLDENVALSHFNILVKEAEKQGFVHYETSNFGKPANFSKHNMSYWLGEKYIGIGPSAHTFNGFERSWNIANNAKYIKAILKNSLPCETEKLSVKNRFNEYIMTGLRTIWGVSFKKIEKDFGANYVNQLNENARTFIDKGLLEMKVNSHKGNILVTTKKGKFLADGIASDLFMI
jgi:oxygen-independent coproporphyrinogen-3 oxidase